MQSIRIVQVVVCLSIVTVKSINNKDSSLKSVRALYDMHVARLESTKTGEAKKT